jgi:hypothetical protein
MFNRGDYFQDFCPYQTRGEMLFVFCFFFSFLIFAPCPIRCFTIPLDRGNGVFMGRGSISLFYSFFYFGSCHMDLKLIFSIQTIDVSLCLF